MRYTDLEVVENYSSMKSKSFLGLTLAMLWQMNKQFFGRYIVKQGFRDGFYGLIIALAMAFYKFMEYSKIIILKYFIKNKKSIESAATQHSIDIEYYNSLIDQLDHHESIKKE